jgi:hypothetical protein
MGAEVWIGAKTGSSEGDCMCCCNGDKFECIGLARDW